MTLLSYLLYLISQQDEQAKDHDGCKLASHNQKQTMAIKKKSEKLNKGAGRETGASAAEEEDEEETEDEAPVTAKPGVKVKVKAGAKAEAAANEELVSLFEGYDEGVKQAETLFVALVEFIQDNQVDRATVVASMMKARGINYESAQSQYSRMRKILNDEEVLEDLKSGKITLKVAREKTKTAQKNPKSAKPEAKEAKYTNTLKAFVASAKESGYSRAEILVGVTAELKSAGIK